MKVNFLRYLLGGVLVAATSWSAQAEETGIQRLGMYVVVTDIDKSQEFYARLFQKQPYVKTDKLIGFDVAGGLYVAFAARGLDRSLTRGDNAVPYVRVKDIEAEFTRVKALPASVLDETIVREGPVSLFRFTDPDGNMIEFFSVAAQ
jgi:catechol 2,3-dioxygenase-like lactoylglutathione lyase family enzyme